MYFHTIEGFAKSGGRFRGRNFYLICIFKFKNSSSKSIFITHYSLLKHRTSSFQLFCIKQPLLILPFVDFEHQYGKYIFLWINAVAFAHGY